MKRILNKTTMAIILAVTMLFAVLGGLLFIRNTQSASALEEKTTIEITADTERFVANSSFKMFITFKTSRTETLSAISADFGPKLDDTTFDTSKKDYLTFSNLSLVSITPYADPFSLDCDSNMIWQNSDPKFSTKGNITFNTSTVVDVVYTELKFSVDVKIAQTVPQDTEIEFTTKNSKSTTITYATNTIYDTPTGTTSVGGHETAEGLVKIVPLKITIKQPSDVNDLSSLKVSQGTVSKAEGTNLLDGKDDSAEKDSFETDLTIKDLSKDLNFYYEAAEGGEGATVKVKKKNGDVELKSGEVTSIPLEDLLTDGEGDIEITVKAETSETKTYTVHVDTVAADFESIIATTDDSDLGDSKVKAALKEAYTAGTETAEYTVNVPSDAKKVKLTLTTTGYNLKNDITLTESGCTLDGGNTVQSGTAFYVTVTAESDTLKIKATAEKEAVPEKITAEKEYTLKFDFVDTDATLKTIEVKGQSNDKVFDNIAEKATSSKVDKYYKVIDPSTAGKAKVTLTANSESAKIQLDGNPYTATTENIEPDTHTITITAEAGNTKQYKFITENYQPLTLKSSVQADFIFEQNNGDDDVKRADYKKHSMEHGIDDADFDRFVIGNIKGNTCMNDFLANFDTDVANRLKIYDRTGDMIVGIGQKSPKGGDEDQDDIMGDSDAYSIGTGWYVEYCPTSDSEVAETIYLSVLGDTNGDGSVNALDVSVLTMKMQASADLPENVEFRLACYIENSGVVRAQDVAAITDHIKGTDISKYFANAA